MTYWNPEAPSHATGDDRFTAEIYFGPSARPQPGVRYGLDEPQAFLVEMGPLVDLRTHFHPIDQFQVFVSGTGRFGRHAVSSACLHYTDGNTPYGPLTPDPAGTGIGFLTLRARTDSGASFMPESRDVLRTARSSTTEDTPHRNITLPPDDLDQITPNVWNWLQRDPDGLLVGRLHLDANERSVVPTAAGAGVYIVVLSGTLTDPCPGRCSANGHLLWLEAGESDATVQAGPNGAALAWLQFPAH